MANQTFYLQDFLDEFPELAGRSGSASGAVTTALTHKLHARARRRIQRANVFGWSWQQAQTQQDLSDGDTSFSEPADVHKYRSLWVVDTDNDPATYVCPLDDIGRDLFVRLVTDEQVDSTLIGQLLLTSTSRLVDGAPRVYSRWNSTIELFPAVDGDNWRVMVDYYRFLEPNLDAQTPASYSDALLQLSDLSLAATLYELGLHLRDDELIKRASEDYRTRLLEELQLDRERTGLPDGEAVDDQLRG